MSDGAPTHGAAEKLVHFAALPAGQAATITPKSNKRWWRSGESSGGTTKKAAATGSNSYGRGQRQKMRCIVSMSPTSKNQQKKDRTLQDTIMAESEGTVVIIHQRRGYLGEWANADKIDLLILLRDFRIVRRKVKLLEVDALGRSDGVDEHPTSDTLP
jgi:hypothetical protein